MCDRSGYRPTFCLTRTRPATKLSEVTRLLCSLREEGHQTPGVWTYVRQSEIAGLSRYRIMVRTSERTEQKLKFVGLLAAGTIAGAKVWHAPPRFAIQHIVATSVIFSVCTSQRLRTLWRPLREACRPNNGPRVASYLHFNAQQAPQDSCSPSTGHQETAGSRTLRV